MGVIKYNYKINFHLIMLNEVYHNKINLYIKQIIKIVAISFHVFFNYYNVDCYARDVF